MYCGRCGCPNPEGSAFCVTCGSELVEVAGTELAAPPGRQVRLLDEATTGLPDPEPFFSQPFDDDSLPSGTDSRYAHIHGHEPSGDAYGTEPSSNAYSTYGYDYEPSDGVYGDDPYAGSYSESSYSYDENASYWDSLSYEDPYHEQDPYLAQYLSQQQYRAEHGYQTPGSPGPRGLGPVPEESQGPLKEHRSLAFYIVLSLVTCGIYGWYATHCIARDANVLCAADGERTTGVGLYVLFSLLTFGIYSIYWLYKVADRLYKNAPAYGVHLDANGLVVLLWDTVGMLLVIGPFIAMHHVLRDLDELSRVYNEHYAYNW